MENPAAARGPKHPIVISPTSSFTAKYSVQLSLWQLSPELQRKCHPSLLHQAPVGNSGWNLSYPATAGNTHQTKQESPLPVTAHHLTSNITGHSAFRSADLKATFCKLQRLWASGDIQLMWKVLVPAGGLRWASEHWTVEVSPFSEWGPAPLHRLCPSHRQPSQGRWVSVPRGFSKACLRSCLILTIPNTGLINSW